MRHGIHAASTINIILCFDLLVTFRRTILRAGIGGLSQLVSVCNIITMYYQRLNHLVIFSKSALTIPAATLSTLRRSTLPHPTQDSLPMPRLTDYWADVCNPLYEAPLAGRTDRHHCIVLKLVHMGSTPNTTVLDTQS